MSDETRGTAIHEAGHIEVARALGATGLRGQVSSDGQRGSFTGRFDGSKADEAVILLAGAKAAGADHGGETDRAMARGLLKGSGMSMGDAQRKAARLVRRRRGAIARRARRLDPAPKVCRKCGEEITGSGLLHLCSERD